MTEEIWEKELKAFYRWGETESAREEHMKLKQLWKKIQPLSDSSHRIMELIIGLEICNWNLENSILALCEAIGKDRLPSIRIGHRQSLTDARWKKVWGYYFSLKRWLNPHKGINVGYETLLRVCDPSGEIEKHVNRFLGKKDELKELYVERLCLAFEHITSFFSLDSAQGKSYQAAVLAIEGEIKKHEYDENILKALELNRVDGRLQPCNHKVFRRFDILISSIGKRKWRAGIPLRGTDGFARASTVDNYLLPIQSWIEGKGKSHEGEASEIHDLLGERDDTKIFLISLLDSLLRAQQSRARKIAESHSKESKV